MAMDELHHYFADLEQQEKFSGVALITQGSVPLFTGAYGYASRSWKIRNTLDIRFDTASITKLFTAVATLQLIERGLLAFDTSLLDFLQLEGTTISRDVNVHHLLTHTSGIADDADEEAGESYEALWQTKPNYTVLETEDFLPQCAYANKPPNFAPGQGCRYCNCGYVLLGLMIEKASGLRYRDYVRQHIFPRAGMQHSDFYRKDRVQENIAEGNDPLTDETGRITGWKKNLYSYPPIGSPDGGAYVTAGDLDRFLRAVKAGELLSPELTRAFFTPQAHHGPMRDGSIEYGYGPWFFVRNGQVIFCEKEGINAGVSGLIRHYPASDINVILLSNMENGVWQPVKTIHEMLGGDSHFRK
jgi:CubicO group peptidase (beta-lactamase class C family)